VLGGSRITERGRLERGSGWTGEMMPRLLSVTSGVRRRPAARGAFTVKGPADGRRRRAEKWRCAFRQMTTRSLSCTLSDLGHFSASRGACSPHLTPPVAQVRCQMMQSHLLRPVPQQGRVRNRRVNHHQQGASALNAARATAEYPTCETRDFDYVGLDTATAEWCKSHVR